MTADAAFRREQRGVALGMAAAFLVTLAALALAWRLGAAAAPLPLAGRLGTALQFDISVLFWLAAGIANTARLRFFSASDIAGSGRTSGSQAVRDAAAVVQNTAEQALLAIGTHLALAATLDRPRALLAALCLLFSLGRLLFWVGYAHGAAARAFGFALTFYPSVAGLLIAGVASLSA